MGNGASQIKSPLDRMLVGRKSELEKISACLRTGRNVLLEGPVGVGKTHLALHAAKLAKKKIYRVDGDSRYTEQKLAGWFDPPAVIKQGYSKKSFSPGPLIEAMESGAVLFINELNRLPEGVQNILLPAIDEKIVAVPRLGVLKAKPGFQVIATQNPKEFVATSHLSEAILDRFELVVLDYQKESEELEIVNEALKGTKIKFSKEILSRISFQAVQLVRYTRVSEQVKRGASIRAAVAISEIAVALLHESSHPATVSEQERAFEIAARIALPTRIEIHRDPEAQLSYANEVDALILEWIKERAFEKKKN